MDKEEREFARNQTDVEIYLKLTLACLTLAGAAVIALAVYMSTHTFDLYALLLTFLTVSMGILATSCVYKTDFHRKQLDEKEEPKEAKPKLQDALIPSAKP
jgi:uncharacterized membrane protein YgaE (UPF0421/DUF939 family)